MSFLTPKAPPPPPAAPAPPRPTDPAIQEAAVAARRRLETQTGGRSLTMLGAQPAAAQGSSFIQRVLGAMGGG